ncbi:MAG TPA: YbfB/YjiJ family MFS transporter, partial [Gammaproteobacteria bacterium]|nr:YbfB/YjiJ family MFS transporter [Gammaproteobacteria bacterium]
MPKIQAMRTAFAAALMLAVAMGIGRFAFTPLLPMMQKDAGLSLALGGWLATANYVGYLLGAYSATHLRFRPARIVPLSLLATALLTAAMAWTREPAAWMALRGLAGVASAWVLIFTSSWALHRLAALAAPGLRGVVFAGVGLGIMAAGLLCMQFLEAGWSSERSWLALGAAALLASVVAAPAIAMQGQDDAPPPTAQHAAGAGREVLLLSLAYGIFGFGYIIPATFLPAMAKQRIADPALFGWAWPLFGMAALVSTLLAGRLMVRYSNRGVWGMSHLVMGAGVLLPLLLPGMGGIVLAALCVGGTFMVITSAGIQEARRLVPHDPAPLMARLTVAFALGQ